MKYKDYYAALDVPRDANLEQIKKAYRKLARTHHPDVSKAPDAESRFKDAAEAYATLKDADKRAAYDALGQRGAGDEFAPPPQWASQYTTGDQAFDNMDLADLLAALQRGHTGGPIPPVPRPGRDYETAVQISLEQAHRGATINLNLADAQGDRSLEVTIPPGVSDGQKLRLRGKGGKGQQGGADGDIYLHIGLAAHPLFRADRHDLYFDLALTPWEAALGAQVQVPTLDGPVEVTVAPGTPSGRKLRLKGRGLANRHQHRGDLYAVVHIQVPPTLTSRERELFEQLAAASRYNPRSTTAAQESP
jgi:curved DNA-binding protein